MGRITVRSIVVEPHELVRQSQLSAMRKVDCLYQIHLDLSSGNSKCDVRNGLE
jgi:hypothetical protein